MKDFTRTYMYARIDFCLNLLQPEPIHAYMLESVDEVHVFLNVRMVYEKLNSALVGK